MRSRNLGRSIFIIRPAVTMVMVYLLLCSVGALWIFCTFRYPLIGSTGPFRIISTAQYASLSALDALFLVALASDGRRAWQGQPDVRRGQVAGLVLACTGVLLVQLGAHYAHGPIPLP